MRVLLSTQSHLVEDYLRELPIALSKRSLDAEITCEARPDTVDYIVYTPNDRLQDFTPYSKTKAVLSLWAGVDSIVNNQTLTQPLCRMVDSGLREGMREWVLGHILADHLHIRALQNVNAGEWREDLLPSLARDKSVVILGFGTLGQYVGCALRDLGFQVSGWSTTQKSVDGITSLVGDIHEAIYDKDYIVSLLPHTQNTENILDTAFFRAMKTDALFLNAGRGAVVDEMALFEAIEQGELRGAVLDVFTKEPLPNDHPFWRVDNITITPHIAAATRAHTASQVVAENIERIENGHAPLHLVDRARGY